MDRNEIVYSYSSNYFAVPIYEFKHFLKKYLLTIFKYTLYVLSVHNLRSSFSELFIFFLLICGSSLFQILTFCQLYVLQISQSLNFVVDFITQKFFNLGLLGQTFYINLFLHFMSYKISITILC